MGDFNITPENHHVKNFIDCNDFETKIKEPACFKSFSPTTNDLFLTNRKGCFMKSSTDKTGMSDHARLICTFLKSTYAKRKHKFVTIDASKNVTKNYLRKIFLKISKTFVIRLKFFMSLSRTLKIFMPL